MGVLGAIDVSWAPGLGYWAKAILNRNDIEEKALARLMAHPAYVGAMRQSARAAVARHAANPLMSRNLKDSRQAVYGIFTLYVAARGELSLKTIREVCAELGFASPGFAAATLLRLRLMGYIVREAKQSDGRVRHYIPSPAMKQAYTEVFRNELLAFAAIEPDALAAAEAMSDPQILHHFILMAGRGLSKIVRSSPPTPITPFAARASGLAILYEIALSGADGDTYPPRGTVRLAVAPLARKFEVSRSHVLRMLRDAERQGLLRRNADEMTGQFDEKLRDALCLFHAANFLSGALCAYTAMQATEKA